MNRRNLFFFLIPILIISTVFIPKSYAVSDIPYSHPVNGADTCAPSVNEAWGIVGVATDSFNYGFGTVSFDIGQYSSDFNGFTVTSISIFMCGYKNDTIADSNPVIIGIYSQADGSLIKQIGSTPFDSLATCKLNQDGSTGTGGTCPSQHPTAITVTGSYSLQDSHSPGGIDFIGVTFPVHSAVGHDVEVFCSNACSSTVVTHGGICDLYGSSNKMCHAGPINTDTPGVALAGTLLFTPNPPSTAKVVAQNSIVILIAILGIIGDLIFLIYLAHGLSEMDITESTSTFISVIIIFVGCAIIDIMLVAFIIATANQIGGLS